MQSRHLSDDNLVSLFSDVSKQDLQRSGITLKDALAFNITPVRTHADTMRVLREDRDVIPVGYALNYGPHPTNPEWIGNPWASHEARIRLDHPRKRPNGKYQRYVSRRKQSSDLVGCHIYLPYDTYEQLNLDWELPPIIVEGEKKAIVLARFCRQHDLPFAVVGIPGVDTGIFNHQLHPELKAFLWDYRDVYILFDNDVNEKESVQGARKRLTTAFYEQGVKDIFYQTIPAGSEKGIDDVIVSKGGTEKALAILNNPTHADSHNTFTMHPIDMNAVIPDRKYFWQKLIHEDDVCILSGDAGSLKSYFCLTLAAMSDNSANQPMNGDRKFRKHVIGYLTTEDTEDEIVRRYRAAGGKSPLFVRDKFSSLAILQLSWEEFLKRLKQLICQHHITLLFIDPITAFINDLDANSSKDTRYILTCLSILARDYHVTIICPKHFSKATEQSAKHRTAGSHEWRSVPRSAFNVVHDEESKMVYLDPHKQSNSKESQTIQIPYTIENEVIVLGEFAKSELSSKEINRLGSFDHATKTQLQLAKQSILNCLIQSPMGMKGQELERIVKMSLKVSKTTFERARCELKDLGKIMKKGSDKTANWCLGDR